MSEERIQNNETSGMQSTKSTAELIREIEKFFEFPCASRSESEAHKAAQQRFAKQVKQYLSVMTYDGFLRFTKDYIRHGRKSLRLRDFFFFHHLFTMPNPEKYLSCFDESPFLKKLDGTDSCSYVLPFANALGENYYKKMGESYQKYDL